MGIADTLPKKRDAVPVRHGQNRIDETKSTRKVINPLNWSITYPGGMQQEWDNTPGHERTRFVYPGGSYDQINADGAKTSVVQGNSFEYHKNGVTITVDQNGDVHIDGHQRISIKGGQHMEVKGDVTMVCTGNMTDIVTGNKDSYVFGNASTTVTGTMALNSGKEMALYTPKGMTMKGDSGVVVQSPGGDITNKSNKLYHNVKDIGDDHKHKDVTIGSADTGVPV